MVLISHFIRKYTRPGAMVLDPYLGSGATAKSCLLLCKHRKFVGWDSDLDCALKMRPSLLRMFAEQVLCSDSDISEYEEVRTAADRYLKMSSSEVEVQRKSIWKAPPDVHLFSHFQAIFSSSSSQYHMDVKFFEK